MEQSLVVQYRKGRFVCKLAELLHGLKVPIEFYNMLDSFMVILNLLRSEYKHYVHFESLENGTFIFLLLYFYDMLISMKIMFKINRLKTQLARMFLMKDLGNKSNKDMKNGMMWLSQ